MQLNTEGLLKTFLFFCMILYEMRFATIEFLFFIRAFLKNDYEISQDKSPNTSFLNIFPALD